MLLVPMSEGESSPTDDASVNVTIAERTLRDQREAGPIRYTAVTCNTSQLFETFGSLCDEILDVLRRTTPSTSAGQVCVEVLERWRNLIGPSRRRLLGTAELAGLLAELHLLERLITRTTANDAFAAWAAGRDPSRHDFQRGQSSIEVKATTSTAHFLVTVHGITQLEPPLDGRLYLYAEQLEPVYQGNDSVPEAADRLVGSGVSRFDLLTALSGRGYLPADADAYETVRFTKHGSRLARVDHSFPALVPSALRDPTLANRIAHVNYSVDVAPMADGDAIGAQNVIDAFLGLEEETE